MTLARLKWPNVTKSATQLVAAAMMPRPCGPRNRAVMTVPIIAPTIQYALVAVGRVMAVHDRNAFILCWHREDGLGRHSGLQPRALPAGGDRQRAGADVRACRGHRGG